MTSLCRGTQGKRNERECFVYAIVRCGGRQEKVALDDVVTVDKLAGQLGSTVTLPALLVVDGERVISDPAEVGRFQVTADIIGDAAGPKINMIHYKNKTGYRRRMGHCVGFEQLRGLDLAFDVAHRSSLHVRIARGDILVPIECVANVRDHQARVMDFAQ